MSDRIYAATRKGLFTIDRLAGKWRITRTAFLADNLSIVLPDRRDGSLYVAMAHTQFGAKLHRSNDKGETWQEIAVPAYPDPPEGAEEIRCPVRNIPIPWKLELVWSLEPGGPDQPGLLWCGTIPGGLFGSNDGGATWYLVESLWNNPARKEWFGGGMDYPGVHSICVDPRDSNRVAIGISCGGVWVTPDCGDTWTCQADGMRAEYMPPEQAGNPHIQDPHRLVLCREQPDKMWAQHHNGIFRTVDGAKSWTEIKNAQPSAFGFAVVVHPKNGDMAWFVPAIKDEKRIPVNGQVVVSRTRDGGQTFEVLRSGLPQQHAYDIAFRHALDIDETGDRLAFGSTTGSLWASCNGGESWEQVSSSLPPIYCVRFAC